MQKGSCLTIHLAAIAVVSCLSASTWAADSCPKRPERSCTAATLTISIPSVKSLLRNGYIVFKGLVLPIAVVIAYYKYVEPKIAHYTANDKGLQDGCKKAAECLCLAAALEYIKDFNKEVDRQLVEPILDAPLK